MSTDQNESEVINSYEIQDPVFTNEIKGKPELSERTMNRNLTTFEEKMTIPMSPEVLDEVNEMIQQNFEKISSGVFQCRLCEKVSKKRIDMKRHVETHLEGLSYPCQQCGKTYRSKDVLRHHIRTHK